MRIQHRRNLIIVIIGLIAILTSCTSMHPTGGIIKKSGNVTAIKDIPAAYALVPAEESNAISITFAGKGSFAAFIDGNTIGLPEAGKGYEFIIEEWDYSDFFNYWPYWVIKEFKEL